MAIEEVSYCTYRSSSDSAYSYCRSSASRFLIRRLMLFTAVSQRALIVLFSTNAPCPVDKAVEYILAQPDGEFGHSQWCHSTHISS